MARQADGGTDAARAERDPRSVSAVAAWLRARLSRESLSVLAHELAFAAAALLTAAPLFAVARPPLEDLPQHLAIVRILHDFHDPALAFGAHYELALGSTQHLAWYLLADLLASVVGVTAAVKLLLAASVIGTPYAVRSLARALGVDDAVGWLAFGVSWSPLLLFGFVQFLAAVPLMLFGLALAARLRSRPSRRTGAAFALVTIACFFTHLVPFGLLCLGALLLASSRDLRASLRRLLWLVPAAVCVAFWLPTTEAGRAVLHTVGLGPPARVAPGQAVTPVYLPTGRVFGEAHEWLADVLTSQVDDEYFAVWLFIALTAAALGTRRGTSGARRVGLLAVGTGALYFALPESYAWIWPIAPRFAVLAVLLGLVALPFPTKRLRVATLAALAALTIAQSTAVTAAFVRFEQDEVGDFDEALAHIPEGRKVAALFFQTSSQNVRFWPFAHFIGHVQAERGGAVVFSFADHPSSPVRWRADTGRPPTGPTGFRAGETRPTDLLWFDYVLTRDGPGAIETSERFEPVYRGARWSVFRAVAASP